MIVNRIGKRYWIVLAAAQSSVAEICHPSLGFIVTNNYNITGKDSVCAYPCNLQLIIGFAIFYNAAAEYLHIDKKNRNKLDQVLTWDMFRFDCVVVFVF